MSADEEQDNNFNFQYSKSQSSGTSIRAKTKRGNFILRQDLKSYTPEFNAKCGIIFNSFLFIIFLSIGVLITFYTNQIIEYKILYTNCSNDLDTNICAINIEINTTITAPVFLYYELNNFHLNHREIVKSKIWSQLRGEKQTGAVYMSEMFNNDTSKYLSFWDHPLKADDYANPCGLVAKAMFNDTYSIIDSNGSNIIINENGIANYYEKNKYFKRSQDYKYSQWMDVENEHFIVWMAMETYSSFKKLWGRIEIDLRPDNYTIYITDNKFIVIMNSSPFGNSSFFGYLLLAGAAYNLLTIFVLWVLHITNKDKRFDYTGLKWKN